MTESVHHPNEPSPSGASPRRIFDPDDPKADGKEAALGGRVGGDGFLDSIASAVGIFGAGEEG
jgi:hypothetical protein